MKRKLNRFLALVMCVITVLSVNASAYAGVLDTISGTKISGYTMGAHRIAEGTFSWYGKGHDHLIMTTAVKASSGTKFSGFCHEIKVLQADKPAAEDTASVVIVYESHIDSRQRCIGKGNEENDRRQTHENKNSSVVEFLPQ